RSSAARRADTTAGVRITSGRCCSQWSAICRIRARAACACFSSACASSAACSAVSSRSMAWLARLFSLVSRSRSLAISALPVRISSCRRAVSVSVMGSPGLGPPRDRGGQAGSGGGVDQAGDGESLGRRGARAGGEERVASGGVVAEHVVGGLDARVVVARGLVQPGGEGGADARVHRLDVVGVRPVAHGLVDDVDGRLVLSSGTVVEHSVAVVEGEPGAGGEFGGVEQLAQLVGGGAEFVGGCGHGCLLSGWVGSAAGPGRYTRPGPPGAGHAVCR